MGKEISLGGNLGATVRVGDTVRRRAGPWTPAVHALLRFLESNDFPAPRVRGLDEEGREILGFIEGEAHSGTFEALPDQIMAEPQLVASAKLLRRYHDLVAGFVPPAGARWRLVAPTAAEIICHNDWSPWNALLQNGRFALTLDWDLAGPGTRLWDIANAAYSWAPLMYGGGKHDIDVQVRRVRLFLDAYGLEDRSEVIPTLRLRLQHVAGFIADQAALGDPGMRRLVWWNVPAQMLDDDMRYLDEHRETLARALSR